ncbi:hypothetical protein CDL15_Pgr026975 [Punica granatum]|uniref:Uncharacterized protein n=1 Tax=Punica granatum TaxID=22663 RepID=A0A218W8B1_PUNGR|nr:hypothetical protein CDL15_Pgr026975 [Punica granatum]
MCGFTPTRELLSGLSPYTSTGKGPKEVVSPTINTPFWSTGLSESTNSNRGHSPTSMSKEGSAEPEPLFTVGSAMPTKWLLEQGTKD